MTATSDKAMPKATLRARRGHRVSRSLAWLVPTLLLSAVVPAAGVAIAAEPITLVASGDIAAQCSPSSSSCVHKKTADVVASINPAAIITMGDNQYDHGTISDFKKYFDKTWGKFKSKIKPSPGNHEYYDDPPAAGYKEYFGSIATPKGKTYYSWEIGNWHFIALDSEQSMKKGSEQLKWLAADLAANKKGCIGAYWHHPLFSSGEHGDNPVSKEVWNLLYAAKTDLVLGGHDHHYERFKPMNPSGKADAKGIRSVVSGGGGAGLYDIPSPHPTTEKSLKKHGVMKLSLTDTTYSWKYVGTDKKDLDSTPTYNCHA